MSGFAPIRRWAAAWAVLGLPLAGWAQPISAWEKAVKAREQLDTGSATKAEWNEVLDGFRAVYHQAPRDVHAPDAVNAVAELLAEEGHATGDAKLLRAAAGQYEFLRVQYPTSRLRVEARLAEDKLETELRERDGRRREDASATPDDEAARLARARPLAEEGAGRREQSETAESESRVRPAERASGAAGEREQGRAGVVAGGAIGEKRGAPVSLRLGAAVEAQPVEMASGAKLAEVTGIRHWSTATYTRVAIDLGDEVKFEAARVPHPDRIYFDLHGARLAAALVGKTFTVTDDGFLTRIRAAQAAGDVTRVVLDVSDVTEYSAFLLPNPYRLIIDIHGGKKGATGKDAGGATDVASVPVPAGAGRAASAAANSSGLPAMAVTALPVEPGSESGGTRLPAGKVPASRAPVSRAAGAEAPRTSVVAQPTVARPVPNAEGVRTGKTAGEVAAVSAAPGRVDATTVPTTRPVVAVVGLGRDGGRASGAAATRRPIAAAGVGEATPEAESVGAPSRAADRTAAGEVSLVRALGLKVGRIVIDAGHGGHDSGTLGVDGIEEKDVVLDVALRLGRLLHERLGAEIIYTRSDDTFIPLETRTAIANKAQADLFLSIHANSSDDPTARGVETYYLNFTSDPTALDVAARENAVGGQGVHQLSDLVKKIALKDKIAESREFASDVEGSLYSGLARGNAGLRDRGVNKAPFVVLIGANMPSILAEISFVTNARDARQLREPEYRQRVAESLFNGVAKYEGGLAGTRAGTVRAAR